MSPWRSEIQVCTTRAGISCPPDVRAAVSLHGHCECSRETLEFIPRIVQQVPFLSRFYERGLAQYESQNGRPLNFGEWYWRPPITPAGYIESSGRRLRNG